MSDETPVKVMIKVGIFAGPKLLYNAGKLFGHCATVHDIIEGTLQRCGRAGCSVLTVSAFKSDEQQGLDLGARVSIFSRSRTVSLQNHQRTPTDPLPLPLPLPHRPPKPVRMTSGWHPRRAARIYPSYHLRKW